MIKDMLEKIFGSRTRVKLLRLFLAQPEKEYFVREIARTVGEQINSVRRELANLENVGILLCSGHDQKKYYRVNKLFALYDEFRAIVLKSRLTFEKEFIKSIKGMGAIYYLVLTGYFVNDEHADVDVLIVGQVQRSKLEALLDKFRVVFGQQLRFTVMNKDEYLYRKDITDKFLYSILNGKRVVVVNKLT